MSRASCISVSDDFVFHVKYVYPQCEQDTLIFTCSVFLTFHSLPLKERFVIFSALCCLRGRNTMKRNNDELTIPYPSCFIYTCQFPSTTQLSPSYNTHQSRRLKDNMCFLRRIFSNCSTSQSEESAVYALPHT